MKKIVAFTLSAIMCASLTGCIPGGNAARIAREIELQNKIAAEMEKNYNSTPTPNAASDMTETEKPTVTVKPKEKNEFEANKIKTDGPVLEVPGEERYEITYYYKYKDTFNHELITVEFEFTNLSGTDRMVDVFSRVVTAYQNGLELKDGTFSIVSTPPGAVVPGGTVTALKSYELRDTESDIVFDMKEAEGIKPVTTGMLKIN